MDGGQFAKLLFSAKPAILNSNLAMPYLIILLVYFLFTGLLIEPVLENLFGFKRSWRSVILASFLSFTFTGFISGIFVIFYKLNLTVIGATLALNLALIFVLRRLVKIPDEIMIDLPDTAVEMTGPTAAWWGVILYLVLAGYGFLMLYASSSSGNIATPWQTIDPLYIYVFAFSTFLVCWLIFSKLPTGVVFFLLIIHGALLHSYLPLTHTLFYGADQWRHVAVESRILAGQPLVPPQLSTPSATLENKLTLTNGLSVSTFAYSGFWGISALIARVTHIDLIILNKWLVPILWAFVLPATLFEIAVALGWRERVGLFLIWLGFLPFTWQALGAMTLPASLGFLVWLLSVLFLLKRLDRRTGAQVPFLAIFGILSLLNYTLYLILFWLGWLLVEAVARLKIKNFVFKIFVALVLSLLIGLVLPEIELVTGYSQVPLQINWRHSFKTFVGNFTGWHLASGPQAGDIAMGNILFNQTPNSSFVANAFTLWRWWLPIFAVIFFALVLFGSFLSLKKLDKKQQWLFAFGSGLFLSYVISRYILTGENIFTRRLDASLAFFSLIFAVTALEQCNFFNLYQRYLAAPILVVFSVAIAASYSLGPDVETVSLNSFNAMKHVWSEEKTVATPCVISGTYSLLALEAISAKAIIGGGFPINQFFAQPELLALYRTFSGEPSEWDSALKLTGAKRCAFVGDPFPFDAPPAMEFGNVGVWWYPR